MTIALPVFVKPSPAAPSFAAQHHSPPAITRRLIEDFCRGPAPGTPAGGTAGALSEREREVVRLVAAGLSNGEIASSLYLSGATIKSHIARILARLGLRDRVQIAVYAYEHGIVRPGHGAPPPNRKTRR